MQPAEGGKQSATKTDKEDPILGLDPNNKDN
jgi:hypothetical protein